MSPRIAPNASVATSASMLCGACGLREIGGLRLGPADLALASRGAPSVLARSALGDDVLPVLVQRCVS